MFPEKILNNDSYTRYQGCFFKKPAEQYPFYENLIKTRYEIQRDQEGYDSYDYDESYYDPYEEDSSYHSDSENSFSLWQ